MTGTGRRPGAGGEGAAADGHHRGGRPVVLVLSGPNLGLLGERQPEIYGRASLDEHVATATAAAERLGLSVEHRQSDHEGDLVTAVHEARRRAAAVVVNAGALSHTSWSLHDALAAFPGVVVELHLSEPAGREPWRRTSVVAPVADGTVAGFGGLGYELAIEAVHRLLQSESAGGSMPGRAGAADERPEQQPGAGSGERSRA